MVTVWLNLAPWQLPLLSSSLLWSALQTSSAETARLGILQLIRSALA
jgi:hypothetical protein